MPDLTVREASQVPWKFTNLTKDGDAYNISGKYMVFCLKGVAGEPRWFNTVEHPSRFTIAPGGVTNSFYFHPTLDLVKAELSDYNAYAWVRDGTEWVDIPQGTFWTIKVVGNLGIVPTQLNP